MTHYADTVAELITQLGNLPPDTKVIGMECAVGVAAIPQGTGVVLLAGRRRPPPARPKSVN